LANAASSADERPSAVTDTSPAVGSKPSVWTVLGLPKPKWPIATFSKAKPGAGPSTPLESEERRSANRPIAVKKPKTALPESVLPEIRAAAETSPVADAYATDAPETEPAVATPVDPVVGSAKPFADGVSQPTENVVVSLEDRPLEDTSPAVSGPAAGFAATVPSSAQQLVESPSADSWPDVALPAEPAQADNLVMDVSPAPSSTAAIPPIATSWDKPGRTEMPRTVPSPELGSTQAAAKASSPSRHDTSETPAPRAISQAKNALAKVWRGDKPAAASQSKQPAVAASPSMTKQVALDLAPQPPALLEEWLTRPDPLAAHNLSSQQPNSMPASSVDGDLTEKARQLLIATDLRAPQRSVQLATLVAAESETSEKPASPSTEIPAADPLDLLSPKTPTASAEIVPSASPLTAGTTPNASSQAALTEPPVPSPSTPFTERATFTLPAEFAPSPTIVTPMMFASPATPKGPVTMGIGDVDASDDINLLLDATKLENVQGQEQLPLAPIFVELRGEVLQIGADESLVSFRAVGEHEFQLGDEVQILSDLLDRRSTKAIAKVIEVGDDYFVGELTGIVPGTPNLRVGDGVIGSREGKPVQPE